MTPQPKVLPLFRFALVLLSLGFVPVRAAVSGRAADRQAVAADPAVAIALQSTGPGAYRFVATNSGSVPVYYTGYGREDGSPVYSVEIFRGGAWQKGKLGWCGVGLGECVVSPKTSITQDVSSVQALGLEAGERFRVVMNFSAERYTGGPGRAGRSTLYSNELRFTPPPPPPENPFLRSFPKKG